jgi:hypothetical protein
MLNVITIVRKKSRYPSTQKIDSLRCAAAGFPSRNNIQQGHTISTLPYSSRSNYLAINVLKTPGMIAKALERAASGQVVRVCKTWGSFTELNQTPLSGIDSGM